jgi:hypothetical protein
VAWFDGNNSGDYSSGYCPGFTPGSLLSGIMNNNSGTITETNIGKTLAYKEIIFAQIVI